MAPSSAVGVVLEQTLKKNTPCYVAVSQLTSPTLLVFGLRSLCSPGALEGLRPTALVLKGVGGGWLFLRINSM